MKAYSLVENILKEKFPFELGSELGYGAQGQVFEIKDSNKVIKLSTLYDVDPNLDIDQVFDRIKNVYEFIVQYRPNDLVRVYEFGRLDSGSRKTINGPQDYIVYYSIQEKLQPLSDDEKKLFKTICQAANNELDSDRDVQEIVKELSCWLRFDAEKALSFYNNLFECPIQNNDFHRRNIMKDDCGCFKLIDFDLAELVKDVNYE